MLKSKEVARHVSDTAERVRFPANYNEFGVWTNLDDVWEKANVYANQDEAKRECRYLVDELGYDAAVVEGRSGKTIYVYSVCGWDSDKNMPTFH